MRPRLTLGMIFAVSLAVLSGCSDDTTVEFHAMVAEGHVWTAEGTPVDQGVICTEGRKRMVAWRQAGRNLTLPEIMDLEVALHALGPDDPWIDFSWVQEVTCADGSGYFEMEEVPTGDGGTWRITGGSAAYANVTGAGECVVEFFTDPESVVPPGEEPIELPVELHCTGTVLSGD